MKSGKMQDRRHIILEAGLAILREEGLAGFTQPKVAAKAGLRQGNLTYYFPTRTDLLAAVARLATDAQLAAVGGMVQRISSLTQAAATIAAVTVRHENSRVLVALNQAADQEPALREMFNELTDGFINELDNLMSKLSLVPSPSHIDLLHALFVGLSVIDLASSRTNGEARARSVMEAALALLASPQIDTADDLEVLKGKRSP
jgi:AcrR family transcriptional regulator